MPDADQLIKNAQHKSVNNQRLTELKGGLTARYLYDKPLIEYLDEGEQPHFILAARQNSPSFLGSDSPSWSGEQVRGMPMHMITDERWIMVIGMKGGDQIFDMHLDSISITDYSTAHSKHSISLQMGEFEIDVPIGNMHDEDEIEDAVSFIRNHGPDTDSSDASSTSESQEESESSDNIGDVQKLVEDAIHDSVTESVLTSIQTEGRGADLLRDEPLITYLEQGEQPNFVLKRNAPPEFYGSYSLDWGKTKGYTTLYAITDQRWLIIQGHRDGDMSLSVPYSDIGSIEMTQNPLGSGIQLNTKDGQIELSPKISTNEGDEIKQIIDYTREMAGVESTQEEDTVEIINRANGISDNSLYAKLIVPTKSSGARISQSGWNIGGDIVRATSSSGRVEEENWENYVKRLIIHDDHVEIGLTHGDLSVTSDNQIHQTLRLDLADLKDIRHQKIEGFQGFVFETTSDVYQFKLGKKGITSMASKEDAKNAVYELEEAVKNAPEPDDSDQAAANEDSTREDDPAEKLTQLKELHDQGVLTDEEFQGKKQELLEEF